MRHLLAGVALILLGLMVSGGKALAQPDSFRGLVKDVMPSVVNISTTRGSASGGRFMASPDAPASLGSGFIVDPRGYVVTNNHVIANADTITVTLESGEEFDATLRGVDPQTDLAVLQITADRRFPSVSFGDSDVADVGDWVVAIGQPFGLGGSVSAGIVSARNRDLESGLYDDYIQTDAAINRGNSGGPLFNMRGEVIGVNTVILSQTGGSVGVGFAVPGNLADRVVGQLIEFGETFRGYLGVLLDDISEEQQVRLGLANTDGALVVSLPTTTSPAALGGIQVDDVIVRFNGVSISDERDLTRAVADSEVGRTVAVTVIRDGRRQVLRVTLARRETTVANAVVAPPPAMDRSSGALSSMDAPPLFQGPARADSVLSVNSAFDRAPGESGGALVRHIDATSPLAGAVQPGDIILEVGWDRVHTPSDVDAYFNALRARGSGPVQVLVKRGDSLFFAHVRP